MMLEERSLLEALMLGPDTPAMTRPASMADAACLEHPWVEFVPPNAKTEENADEARAVCAACSCQEDCLVYALADDTLLGIWAGTTTAERRAMRRQAKRAS